MHTYVCFACLLAPILIVCVRALAFVCVCVCICMFANKKKTNRADLYA